MRYLCTLFLLIYSFSTVNAQTDSVSVTSYTAKFDSSHSPLITGTVPYNRLYDRVFPWAGLNQTTSGDTVSFTLFKQAWYELELSRFLLSVPPYASYRS
ncbi:MAG: hypothetical protein J5I59_12715 [Saprospiraceae bacterium]|nr:hypothetical protein [Saprospiraceae bacterium]